jgi:flagellar hook-basal body complex protein FliE
VTRNPHQRTGQDTRRMDPISMDSLLAKLQAAREVVSGVPAKTSAAGAVAGNQMDFAAMLKSTLDGVNKSQVTAATLAEKFQLGDPKVSLEDSMVAMQKANVSFQAAIQVRNRVVQAYHDIMNLQI